MVTYITAPTTAEPPGLGLSSIADYSSVFTEKDYESRLQTFVLDSIEAHKSDHVALARLRTAWQLARSDVAKACKARVEGSSAPDWDAPLEQEDEDTRKQQDE